MGVMQGAQVKNFDSKQYENLVDPNPDGGAAAPVRVAQLIDRLGRLTRELQYVDGLNPAQWETLRFLSRANRVSRTASAVAEFLCATKGTVSQTISALENKGLLVRTPSEKDKRVTHLDLTERGGELIARDPVGRIENSVNAMDSAAADAMVQGLSRLLNALQADRDGPSFGVCKACCRHLTPEAGCGSNIVAKCGVTGQPLDTDDSHRLCVNFRTE